MSVIEAAPRQGVSDTKFDPNADVTREQMCAFVGRFLRLMGYDLAQGAAKTFSDVSGNARFVEPFVK